MSITWLGQPGCHSIQRAGGKAAALSRLAASYPVPPGFCLPARRLLRRRLTDTERGEINMAYQQLGERCGLADLPVAVRSSAIDEDGQKASFAGQHATFLNVCGIDHLLQAVEACLASALSPHALHYRRSQGLDPQPRLAVLVQQLLPADVSVVVFSLDPNQPAAGQVVINASWGLGESLVGGEVTPDLYRLARRDPSDILIQPGVKRYMTIPVSGGTRQVPVPRALQAEPCLSPAQAQSLARLALDLEAQMGWPVDVEACFAGGKLYLLQCRPVTAQSQPALEQGAIWSVTQPGFS